MTYNILYDNDSHQYMVAKSSTADKYLQYLNVTKFETSYESEDEALDKIDAIVNDEHEGKRVDHVRIYNSQKKKAKEAFYREMWENDYYFKNHLLRVDFAGRMNKCSKDAFRSTLECTSYMRRLMWYLYDDKYHDKSTLKLITDTMEAVIALMCKDPQRELWKSLSQFVDVLALVPELTTTEQYRIEDVRELILENNAKMVGGGEF